MEILDANKLMKEFSELHTLLECLWITDHYYEDIHDDVELPENDYSVLRSEIERIEAELQGLEGTYGIAIISDKIIRERISKCDGWIKAYEKFVAEGEIEKDNPIFNVEEQKVLKAKYEAELRKRGA